MNIHWKDCCWSWISNTLVTWCEKLTHWKRLWCWERLKAGGEGDDRRWDGWMASLTWCTWVWARSGSWWWTGKPGMLQSTGSQRVGHDWATELNWIELNGPVVSYFPQCKPEFCNKEFMIWATINSMSCFCWLFRASPSLATKNIINLILVLTIWWCTCVESSLV